MEPGSLIRPEAIHFLNTLDPGLLADKNQKMTAFDAFKKISGALDNKEAINLLGRIGREFPVDVVSPATKEIISTIALVASGVLDGVNDKILRMKRPDFIDLINMRDYSAQYDEDGEFVEQDDWIEEADEVLDMFGLSFRGASLEEKKEIYDALDAFANEMERYDVKGERIAVIIPGCPDPLIVQNLITIRNRLEPFLTKNPG